MRKRVGAALAILCVAFSSVVLWLKRDLSPDPVYQGKRLSQWLDDLDSGGQQLSVSAALAVRHFGTNALPRLLREAAADGFSPVDPLIQLLKRQRFLRVHFQTGSDHQARALRGLTALGELGAKGLVQGLTNSDPRIRLGCVGQWELAKIYPAVLSDPFLDQLKDSQPKVRARAANAAGMLTQEPERAIPALTGLLQDPNDWVRCMAALGLSCFREQAKSAVPVILVHLTNCTSSFRFFGTNALKAIQPQALTNINTLR